jgi:hypothetical protein
MGQQQLGAVDLARVVQRVAQAIGNAPGVRDIVVATFDMPLTHFVTVVAAVPEYVHEVAAQLGWVVWSSPHDYGIDLTACGSIEDLDVTVQWIAPAVAMEAGMAR